MISVKVKAGALQYENVYFADKPVRSKYFGLAVFSRCAASGSETLLFREAANTKIVDLTPGIDQIRNGFPKDTQYDIRRAERDGVVFSLEDDFSAFCDYYASFTRLKNMPVLPAYYLEAHRPHLVVTKAMAQNEVLCMHSYLVDRQIGRAMLFTSSSHYRASDSPAKRSLVGRANRWLHFRDMTYFKQDGFKYYDLGGYAVNTTDSTLKKINEFKDSFSGTLVTESTFTTIPLWTARMINKAVLRRRGRK